MADALSLGLAAWSMLGGKKKRPTMNESPYQMGYDRDGTEVEYLGQLRSSISKLNGQDTAEDDYAVANARSQGQRAAFQRHVGQAARYGARGLGASSESLSSAYLDDAAATNATLTRDLAKRRRERQQNSLQATNLLGGELRRVEGNRNRLDSRMDSNRRYEQQRRLQEQQMEEQRRRQQLSDLGIFAKELGGLL